MSRLVLVGMRPASIPMHDAEDDGPLGGRVGRRLAKLCGVSYGEYLTLFERENVVDYPGDHWPAEEARERATRLERSWPRGTRAIVMGLFAWNAFKLPEVQPFHDWVEPTNGVRFTLAPHPSGMNRWWNSQVNVEEARNFWKDVTAFRTGGVRR